MGRDHAGRADQILGRAVHQGNRRQGPTGRPDRLRQAQGHLSDRIALFKDGRIEQVGTGEDLYLRPATDFVTGFIGNSNFLAAECLETVDGVATIRLAGGEVISGVKAGQPVGRGQKARLMVRPEAFRLRAGAATAGFAVEIVDRAFFGERQRVVARTVTGQEIDIRPTTDNMAGSMADAQGGEASGNRQVFFDPAAAFLFPE